MNTFNSEGKNIAVVTICTFSGMSSKIKCCPYSYIECKHFLVSLHERILFLWLLWHVKSYMKFTKQPLHTVLLHTPTSKFAHNVITNAEKFTIICTARCLRWFCILDLHDSATGMSATKPTWGTLVSTTTVGVNSSTMHVDYATVLFPSSLTTQNWGKGLEYVSQEKLFTDSNALCMIKEKFQTIIQYIFQ